MTPCPNEIACLILMKEKNRKGLKGSGLKRTSYVKSFRESD